MKIRLNSKDDAMYLKFDDSKIEDSEEIKPGIVLDYDANDRVIGIEIMRINERFDMEKLKKLDFSAA